MYGLICWLAFQVLALIAGVNVPGVSSALCAATCFLMSCCVYPRCTAAGIWFDFITHKLCSFHFLAGNSPKLWIFDVVGVAAAILACFFILQTAQSSLFMVFVNSTWAGWAALVLIIHVKPRAL